MLQANDTVYNVTDGCVIKHKNAENNDNSTSISALTCNIGIN